MWPYTRVISMPLRRVSAKPMSWVGWMNPSRNGTSMLGSGVPCSEVLS